MIRDPFPPTPEGFHHRLVDTLDSLAAGKRRRVRRVSLVLAATLALVLLGAAAFAATHAEMFEWLFGKDAPVELVEQVRQKPGLTVERDGVRFTVDEYYYDGNVLSLTYTVASARDGVVLYGLDEPAASVDLPGMHSHGDIGYWQFDTLRGEQRQSAVQLEVPRAHAGKPIDLHLTARFYEPVKRVEQFARKPGMPSPLYPDEAAVYLDAQGCCDPYEYPAVYQAMRAQNQLAESDGAPEDYVWLKPADVFLGLGLVRPLAELSLDLRVGAAPGAARHTRFAGQSKRDFGDYRLTVDRVDFSAASSVVEFTIERQLKEGEAFPPDTLGFDVLDQSGQRMKNISWSISGGSGPDLLHSETWLTDAPPLAVPPTKITIMPYDQERYKKELWEKEIAPTTENMQPFYLAAQAVTLDVVMD